jgi:PEP-CTERM motif
MEMRRTIGILVAGLLIGPVAADAAVVTWEVRGSITTVFGNVPVFGTAQVGDPFVVTMSFDTSATLLATRPFPPGTRYDYDNSSLVMTVQVGSGPPVTFPFGGSASTSSFNRILLRDDSGDQLVAGQPADGISFGLLYDGTASIGLVFRTNDLNVVDGPGLPASPYAGMENYPVSNFQWVSQDFNNTWSLAGDDLTSIRRVGAEVPEPGSLALLSLGLVGFGMSRRYRAA